MTNSCPDPTVHGNPFRYCPYCDWVESIPVSSKSPCDWDQESYCVVEGCSNPASHTSLIGMIDEDTVTEMVCCIHSLTTN